MWKAGVVIAVIAVIIGALMPAEPPRGQAGSAAIAKAAPGQPVRLERRRDGHFYVDAMVNDVTAVNFVVDTGASMIVLTEEDAGRVGIKLNPSDYRVIGSGASGAVRGQTFRIDKVDVGGIVLTDLDGAVAEGLEQSLLGQAYLNRLNSVSMTGEIMTLQ